MHASLSSCHLTTHQQIKCNDGPNCHIVTISQTICLVREGQENLLMLIRIMGVMRILETGSLFGSTLTDHWKSVDSTVTFQCSRWSFKVLVLDVCLKICLGACRQSLCVCWPVSSVYLYSESIVLTGPNDAMNNNQRKSNNTLAAWLQQGRLRKQTLHAHHTVTQYITQQYTTYRHYTWIHPNSIWAVSIIIYIMCKCT